MKLHSHFFHVEIIAGTASRDDISLRIIHIIVALKKCHGTSSQTVSWLGCSLLCCLGLPARHNVEALSHWRSWIFKESLVWNVQYWELLPENSGSKSVVVLKLQPFLAYVELKLERLFLLVLNSGVYKPEIRLSEGFKRETSLGMPFRLCSSSF